MYSMKETFITMMLFTNDFHFFLFRACVNQMMIFTKSCHFFMNNSLLTDLTERILENSLFTDCAERLIEKQVVSSVTNTLFMLFFLVYNSLVG